MMFTRNSHNNIVSPTASSKSFITTSYTSKSLQYIHAHSTSAPPVQQQRIFFRSSWFFMNSHSSFHSIRSYLFARISLGTLLVTSDSDSALFCFIYTHCTFSSEIRIFWVFDLANFPICYSHVGACWWFSPPRRKRLLHQTFLASSVRSCLCTEALFGWHTRKIRSSGIA